MLIPRPVAAQPAALPSPGYVDEAEFRDGLRQRGLGDWLEQYLADHPPADDADQALRRRESLLAQAAQADLPLPERRRLIEEATSILTRLVEHHPEHPAQLRWHLELAVDHLERQAPASFDAVLLYELPGRDGAKVREQSGEAIRVLESLREQVAQAWEAVGALEEGVLDQLAVSGATRPLQAVDSQSLLLLAWARLYHALSQNADEPGRGEALAELYEQVTEHHGWTQLPPGHEFQRCHALAIASMTARESGRFDQADRAARDLVASLQRVSSPLDRQRLERIALLGVLEQIRILRDRGQLPEADRLVQQARDWIVQTRPDDVRAALAVARVDHSVRLQASREGDSTPRRTDWFSSAAVLAPLEGLARLSPVHRDALYAALAGVVVEEQPSAERTVFARQLFVGGAVFDATVEEGRSSAQQQATGHAEASPGPAKDSRPLSAVCQRLEQTVAALQPEVGDDRHRLGPGVPAAAAWSWGETLFLLGRGQYLLGRHRDAVHALAGLVEQLPEHDRALAAARQGTAVAEEWLRQQDSASAEDARAAFVRIGRLLRRLEPAAPSGGRLQYLIGLALEQNGQLEGAAGEYGAVPQDDPLGLRAALGRARCLRNVLARTDAAQAEPAHADVARKAVEAAQVAAEVARDHHRRPANDEGRPDAGATPGTEGDGCLHADILLVLANVLNHPAVGRPGEALAVLEELEHDRPQCPAAGGSTLRERILALRNLGRFGEAREVVGRFLTAEPQQAGQVMSNLLEAMREEITAAADRGDTSAMGEVAVEASGLAAQLLEWVAQGLGRVPPEDLLTIRAWRAWAMLMADQPADALAAYEACQQAARAESTADAAAAALHVEIHLGRAECLLELGRLDEALPLFTEVWQSAAEQSPYWWRALTGSLDCHTRLGSDPNQIVQTIRQQRHLYPDLGAPRWKRRLEALEQANMERLARDR